MLHGPQVTRMPTIAEIEKNPSEWSKQYTQDGRLVYVNKKTGKKVSRKPTVEERALEIAARNREGQSSPAPPDKGNPEDSATQNGNKGSHENAYVQQYTIDRTPFYMHLHSGEVMWFLPRDTPQTAVKYITHVTESGVPYYENVEKKTTHWTLPLEKMTSLARKNASTYRKYSRPQVEAKLHITYEDARKESYLANNKKSSTNSLAKSGASSPDGDLFKKQKKTPDKNTPSRYHNIASKDFNNVTLSAKTAAANSEADKVEGIFGSGKERGKPLVRIVFERYDRNKDGFVDSRELQDLCYDFGSFLTEEELRSAIDRFDTSETGSLNYIDFIVWWRNTETFSSLKITDGDVRQRSAAAEIFKRYDDQRVGYITRHQFRPLHAELVAAGLTSLTLEKCMSDLDANSDGIVQFNEFIAWLDKSRKEWEGSSKNVARKLSTFKNSGPTLKKLFGDLMTSPNEGTEEETPMIMAKDHPDYAKYFRMMAVGGDARDVMPLVREAGLDPSVLQTPNLIIPVQHTSRNGSPDVVSKEEKFTNQFRRVSKPEGSPTADPPPVPVTEENVNINPFTFDPDSYIYTSISKPLGLSLGENVPECAMGVYVESCAPGGKAEATGVLYPGLVLISACGIDVQAYDFDSVMDILRNAPSDVPVDLVFADPSTAVLNEEPPAIPAETDYKYDQQKHVYEALHVPTVTAQDSIISDDPFGEDEEKQVDTAEDSFSYVLDKSRQEAEVRQLEEERSKRSFSSRGAAAAVLKTTARRKLEAQNSSAELDIESSPIVPSTDSFRAPGGVFGFDRAELTDASLFKSPEVPSTPPVGGSTQPSTVTRVSSLKRGRNNLKEALKMESSDEIREIATSFSSPMVDKQDSTLDVDCIMGRAKAPPKRIPSDIIEKSPGGTAQHTRSKGDKYLDIPPPPKPSTDMLCDEDGHGPPSPPIKTVTNPMFRPPTAKANPATKASSPPSAAGLTFSPDVTLSSRKMVLSPLTTASKSVIPASISPVDEDEDDYESYVPASSMVLIDAQSDFNPVSKKPMSVFNHSAGTATPSPLIDTYLRDKYGGVPLNPPEGMAGNWDDDFPTEPIVVNGVAVGCQTDYSAYMDAEYQTSYQMLLGEKAEVQAILARVRAEELAVNARIQRAEDESFRRCEEREAYLSEMLAMEEERAMESISAQEEILAEKQRELEAGWEALRTAEAVAKDFHNRRMNDLLVVAAGLVQHHKKLLDDKRKVGKQRLSLDLAMRDINNYTHFSPFGEDNVGYSSVRNYANGRDSFSTPAIATQRRQQISDSRPSQVQQGYPEYGFSPQPKEYPHQRSPSRNHLPGQGRASLSRQSPGGNRSLVSSMNSSTRPKSAPRSRQIDYRNL